MIQSDRKGIGMAILRDVKTIVTAMAVVAFLFVGVGCQRGEKVEPKDKKVAPEKKDAPKTSAKPTKMAGEQVSAMAGESGHRNEVSGAYRTREMKSSKKVQLEAEIDPDLLAY
jgi:FtsZ-interacting cell division protein ZipA